MILKFVYLMYTLIVLMMIYIVIGIPKVIVNWVSWPTIAEQQADQDRRAKEGIPFWGQAIIMFLVVSVLSIAFIWWCNQS
jgi:hypothetical protein